MSDQSTIQVLLWGKNIELDVVFDCYEGENVLPQQEHALQMLLDNWTIVNDALPSVQRHIENEDDATAASDVFEFVKPTELFIKRSDNTRVVALMCEYKFDPEHGLAVVFENEMLSGIMQEGDVL